MSELAALKNAKATPAAAPPPAPADTPPPAPILPPIADSVRHPPAVSDIQIQVSEPSPSSTPDKQHLTLEIEELKAKLDDTVAALHRTEKSFEDLKVQHEKVRQEVSAPPQRLKKGGGVVFEEDAALEDLIRVDEKTLRQLVTEEIIKELREVTRDREQLKQQMDVFHHQRDAVFHVMTSSRGVEPSTPRGSRLFLSKAKFSRGTPRSEKHTAGQPLDVTRQTNGLHKSFSFSSSMSSDALDGRDGPHSNFRAKRPPSLHLGPEISASLFVAAPSGPLATPFEDELINGTVTSALPQDAIVNSAVELALVYQAELDEYDRLVENKKRERLREERKQRLAMKQQQELEADVRALEKLEFVFPVS